MNLQNNLNVKGNGMEEKKIVTFARSRELNGINELKNSLPLLSQQFLKVENFLDLIKILCIKRDLIKCVFCLSSIDFLLCIWIMQIFKVKFPVVLGVYHPKQMQVSLDENYSRHQKKLFLNLFSQLSLEHIIFNSSSCFESSMKIFLFSGEQKNIIVCPTAKQKMIKNILSEDTKMKSDKFITIVTVSRFVDFKACTIFAMIDVLDELNSKEFSFMYHIYGAGHLRSKINQKIKNSKFPENYILYDYLEPNKFNETVLKYDIFFGMGYALTNASMLGIPSLIAIQDEKKPLTYGFFSEYDHRLVPMFGDKTDNFPLVSIESKLRMYTSLSYKNRSKIGVLCQEAWQGVFDSDLVLPKMLKVFDKAKYVRYQKISFVDIVRIRME